MTNATQSPARGVEVTQEDRKLIAAIIMEYDGTDTGRRMARNVLDKNHDDDKIIALAVSHRIVHQSTGEVERLRGKLEEIEHAESIQIARHLAKSALAIKGGE